LFYFSPFLFTSFLLIIPTSSLIFSTSSCHHFLGCIFLYPFISSSFIPHYSLSIAGDENIDWVQLNRIFA
jgi:hypothetical protein